jgi:hypothetical protein
MTFSLCLAGARYANAALQELLGVVTSLTPLQAPLTVEVGHFAWLLYRAVADNPRQQAELRDGLAFKAGAGTGALVALLSSLEHLRRCDFIRQPPSAEAVDATVALVFLVTSEVAAAPEPLGVGALSRGPEAQVKEMLRQLWTLYLMPPLIKGGPLPSPRGYSRRGC